MKNVIKYLYLKVILLDTLHVKSHVMRIYMYVINVIKNSNIKVNMICILIKKKSCIIAYTTNTLINQNEITNTLINQNEIIGITDNKLNNLIKIDELNKCLECNKIFASDKSLKRHILNYCKSYEIINKSDLIQKIYELKKELNNKDLSKLDEININSKNQISVNNTVNNITINAYGKEDLSHITEKDYKNIFNKCNSAIPMLIELVHFNEDKPENTNVYISNMKSQYAYVYDGKKWILKNKNELIDDIYDNKCIILLEKYDDLKNILNDQTIRMFEHFKTKYDTDDMKENVLNRIELVLYNNRNLIKK